MSNLNKDYKNRELKQFSNSIKIRYKKRKYKYKISLIVKADYFNFSFLLVNNFYLILIYKYWLNEIKIKYYQLSTNLFLLNKISIFNLAVSRKKIHEKILNGNKKCLEILFKTSKKRKWLLVSWARF